MEAVKLTPYVGVKSIKASAPMTKKEYCEIRGWVVPANEDSNEMVVLVEYPLEPGKIANVPGYDGYVSMSPLSVFEKAYAEVTGDTEEPALSEIIERNYNGKAITDGYHTRGELYDFRKMYNCALFNEWAAQGKYQVHKSKKHHDGEDCFGGGWFIVVAVLPTGQISNHYKLEDWNLFNVPTAEKAMFEFDGHTPEDVLARLEYLTKSKPVKLDPKENSAPQEAQPVAKSLGNTDANGAKKNVKDIKFWGNGDTFKLISKASSAAEGWMKSTKAMEIPFVGCVIQVTTQQGDNVSEAVTFVPGVKIVEKIENEIVVERKIISIHDRIEDIHKKLEKEYLG